MYDNHTKHMKTEHSKTGKKMTHAGSQRKSHAKTPFTPQQIRLIHEILKAEGSLRDIALLFTGLDTMLRASDLLQLTIEDVFETGSEKIKNQLLIKQNKTAEPVLVELSPMSQDLGFG